MGQDCQTISDMIQVLECLEAREKLAALEVASFTTMKKEDRTKLSRSVHKYANPMQERRALSPSDFANMMGAKVGI